MKLKKSSSKQWFHITPKDKKLLKSSKVRKHFKYMEKVVGHHLKKQDAYNKIIESYALGIPLMVHDDGRIELIKGYYK